MKKIFLTLFLGLFLFSFNSLADNTNPNKIISYYECENNVSDYYNLNNADAFNINYVDGFLGKGCYFNGSDSTYIQINHSDSLNYYNNLTICFWHSLSLNSKDSRETYIFKRATATTQRSILFEHYHDATKQNVYNINLGVVAGTSDLQTSTSLNSWNHTSNSNNFVCFSWDYNTDNTIRVYINGNESSYYTGSPVNKTDYMYQNVTNWILGKSTTAGRFIKNQTMDEIGFYYYLNSTEIKLMYDNYLLNITPFDGYQPSFQEDNIVLYLPLSKNSTHLANNITYDWSPNTANNGTIYGSPVIVNDTISFDSVNDFVNISLQNAHTNQFTWSAWIYPVNINNYQMIYGNGNGGVGGCILGVRTTNRLHMECRIDGVSIATAGTTDEITPNQWNHVTLRYNTTHITSFINGVQSNINREISGNISTTHNFYYVGKWATSSQYFFNGSIRDVIIHNTSLRAEDISYIYNATSPYFTKNTTTDITDPCVYSGSGNFIIQDATCTISTAYNLNGNNMSFINSNITMTAFPYNWKKWYRQKIKLFQVVS